MEIKKILLFVMMMASGAIYSTETQLIGAVKTSANAKFIKGLIKPDTINAQDAKGRTALIHAVKCNNYGIVTLLCKSNAELDILDNTGWNALAYAINHNYYDIANLLIEMNAKLNVRIGQLKATFLILAIEKHKQIQDLLKKSNSSKNRLLEEYNIEVIESLIQNDIRLLNAVDYVGNTPIMYAILNDDIAMCRFLKSKGAYLGQRNQFGLTYQDIAQNKLNDKKKAHEARKLAQEKLEKEEFDRKRAEQEKADMEKAIKERSEDEEEANQNMDALVAAKMAEAKMIANAAMIERASAEKEEEYLNDVEIASDMFNNEQGSYEKLELERQKVDQEQEAQRLHFQRLAKEKEDLERERQRLEKQAQEQQRLVQETQEKEKQEEIKRNKDQDEHELKRQLKLMEAQRLEQQKIREKALKRAEEDFETRLRKETRYLMKQQDEASCLIC